MELSSNISGIFYVSQLNSLIPVPDIYLIKMLVLDYFGGSVNGGGLTVVVFLPCHDGAGASPPLDPVNGSVPVVPLVLKRDPVILLINRECDYSRRVHFVLFLFRIIIDPFLVQLNFVSTCTKYSCEIS